jgi:hypothetical protein
MSTTRSISDIPYTIVGGTRVQQSGQDIRGISAVVLDRGSRTVRSDSLESLVKAGVDEIVAVLGPAPHYDVEQLASRISSARFVLLGSEVTPGEQINIGVHESMYPLVLVIWSDSDLGILSDRVMQRIHDGDALCAVPTIRSERAVVVPSVTAPAFHGTLFRTIPTQPGKQRSESLYPFDYVGMYNRRRFTSIGGYDRNIQNPYWQRLDFGVRAYLWGERIAVVPEFRVDASRPLPPDDTTPDASYARFHLKNLAVKFGGDSGRIPLRYGIRFLFRSGLGPAAAIRVFREVRAWVKGSRYRFTQDARRLTELWEVDD